jgi:hypothetical protein
LEINSGCGNDIIFIKQTEGDIALNSGAGWRSSVNVTVQDTLGGIDIDFGSAQKHTMILRNTQGSITIDTGFKVDRSFISIENTLGDIDLKMGAGKFHRLVLTDTAGDANLKYGFGDKTIQASNTNKLTAMLGNGNDQIHLSQTLGEVSINTGDGFHQFELSNTNGDASITAGEGDFIFNGHNDDVNTAANVRLKSGNGNRQILGTATQSFTIELGNGNDHIDLSNTADIKYRSGDGLHEAKFDVTEGNIDVDVGRADDYGSQLFTIASTTGSIKLRAGKGNHRYIIANTYNGNIWLETGQNFGVGVFDIKDTFNGDISIMSAGGTRNNVTVVNTAYGIASSGNVAVVIGRGACFVDIGHASGDIYIDLQSSGEDVVDVLEIGGSINVKTWSGNDLIMVNKLYGSLLIDAGPDNDEIIIDYLGGNGTILGGSGNDKLLLDARGDSGGPMNTMDGSHIVFNGGDGDDRIELYYVSVGTMNLLLYNIGAEGLFGRCSDEDYLLTPSFNSSGSESLQSYIFVNVQGCCAARFSWDAMCSENSARRRIQQNDATRKYVFAPNYSSMNCESRQLIDFGSWESEIYDTLHACCRDRFPNSITSCCEAAGTSGCDLSGTVQWLPDWANGHCYEKDINLIEEWEWRWTRETLETCCNRCKYFECGLTVMFWHKALLIMSYCRLRFIRRMQQAQSNVGKVLCCR